MRRLVLVASLVGLWFAGSAAQQPQAPPAAPSPTFRSGVEIITLDVSVLDGSRQPVRGLTAADFAILENGKAVHVAAFKAIDLPDRRAYAAPWMREIAPDVVTNNMDAERVIVLLLDDFNVSTNPADVVSTKEIARGIVNQLGPSDVAAVVYTFSHQKSQDFTSDRARLLAAVERFTSSYFREPAGPSVPNMMCPHNECVTAALRSITQVLHQGWPGRRKAIAYVSPEGNYTVGPQSMGSAETGLTVIGASAAVWDSGPDLQRTFRALQEANVSVYQYDPRGLADSLGIIIAPNTTGVMGMFADNSGGRTVTRSNAPASRVQEMFVENSSYYMLGFQPAGSGPEGRLRPIQVKVARPDVEVRTRAGYYPTSSKPAAPPKRAASVLEKAMDGTLPSGDLAMSLTVTPFAIPGPLGGAVAIIAGLDRGPDLPGQDVVEVAARAFDESRLDRRSRGVATSKINLARRGIGRGTVHYDVATRLDVAPGRYQIRLAMDSSATRRTGSAFAFVTVPDFQKAPLTLSGVVLVRLPFARPTGRDPLNGLLPFIPTTTRTFTRTDRIGAVMRIYQGGKDPLLPVAITTRVIDQTDRTVFEQAVTAVPDIFLATARTSEHNIELPLARLEPGEYLLSIEASAGKLTETRHVRLRVQD